MKYMYFLAYKYNTTREEEVDGVKKVLTMANYSSDRFELDFEIQTLEDVYKTEKYVHDVLKNQCEKRGHLIVGLLLLSFHRLKK